MESIPGPSYKIDFGDLLEDPNFSQVILFDAVEHKIDFTWIIHKFSTFIDGIYSQEFSLVDTCNTKWMVSLISTCGTNTRDLDMKLIKTDNHSPNVRVESQLTMVNTEGKVIGETVTDAVLSTFRDNVIILSAPHPLKSVIKKDRVDLPDDKLFINGKLKITHCCIRSSRMSVKSRWRFIPRPNERIEKCIIERYAGDIED